MKRWLVLAVCVAAAVACDPLLPLRVRDEVQPVHELRLQAPPSVQSGVAGDLIIEALDGGGNLIDLDGKTITFSSSAPTILQVVAGSQVDRLRITGQLVGTATISVEVDGKRAEASVSVTPGAASQIQAMSGQAQLGVVNDALLQPIVLQVRDAATNAVPNASVAFTTTSGVVSPTTGLTNSSGQVSVTYTPFAVGNQTITARIGTTASLTLPITVTTVQPVLTTTTLANPRSGIVMTPAPAVQLQYASNSEPYPRSGKTITASITGSTGRTITGGTGTTNASGTATFDTLKVSGTAGAVTLRFTVSGAGTSIDAPVTLRGGSPASMAISTQPSTSVVTGRVFNRPPVIQLYDAWNNESPESNVSLLAASTSATLANALVVSDTNGRATFGTLTLTGTAGTRTLSFSSPSHTTLTSLMSASFLLTGVESRLQMDRTTSLFACAAVPTTTPRVQLLDANGNAVPQSGITIRAAFATGTTGATIDAGDSATTDATGLATFSALKLKGTAGSYTLDFTAPSLTKASMATSIGAGVPDTLKIITQPPTTATNGVSLSTSPVVRVYDECNNVVTNTPVEVTAGTMTGSITFTNGVRTTSSGDATFSSLQMAGLVGNYRLRFTAPNVGADTATVVTSLAKGAAAKVVLITEPSTSGSSNVNLPTQPRVMITDVGGNGVGGTRTVTASIAAPTNGTTVSGNTANVTSPDSIGTFSTLKLTGIAGSYRLVFSSNLLADDTSAAPVVLGGAGTASKITLDTTPSTGVFSSTVFQRPPVIQLRDSANNPVSLANITVTVSAAGNPFTINNGTRTTDANGKVSFGTMSLTGSAQASGALTFTVAGLTAVTSSPATVIVPTALTNNVAISVNDVAGTNRYYAITVPAGRTSLTVSITSGTGDADIYVRASDLPDPATSAFACSSVTAGTSNESCTINTPAAATYFILVKGTTSYSGQLKGVYP